jgi:hypothetical protein
VKEYMTKRWRDGSDMFAGIKDEALKKILERTMVVEDLRKEVNNAQVVDVNYQSHGHISDLMHLRLTVGHAVVLKIKINVGARSK